jgi:hypothetical protein
MKNLKNLDLVLKGRITHKLQCGFWKDRAVKDCTCGRSDVEKDIHSAIALDVASLITKELHVHCVACRLASPDKGPDGFYHKVNKEKTVWEDYCENSPAWALVWLLAHANNN